MRLTERISPFFQMLCSFGCFFFTYLTWRLAQSQQQPAASPAPPQRGEPLVLSHLSPTALIIFGIVVFILGIALLVIAIRGEIKLRRKTLPAQKDQADKKPDQLPPSRPIVVPIRYGKITSGPEIGHSGISLRNDGEPAYSVSAHKVILSGLGTFEMTGTPEQLRKGDPELSFGCWRDTPSGGSLGGMMYEFMVRHCIDEISIPVTYRDADFNWYQTDVRLIKDQMARSISGSESGIRVDWKQKTIPPPNNVSEQNGEQPDVALVWDWTQDQIKLEKAYPLSESEKNILVHNRSTHYIYKVTIDSIPLDPKLRFDPINEAAPNALHVAIARWNRESTVRTKYKDYFSEVFLKGNEQWIHKKEHDRGLSESYLELPIAVEYEVQGIRWRCEFDFIYDGGTETKFIRKRGYRI
jgi:hypothetical protein